MSRKFEQITNMTLVVLSYGIALAATIAAITGASHQWIIAAIGCIIGATTHREYLKTKKEIQNEQKRSR